MKKILLTMVGALAGMMALAQQTYRNPVIPGYHPDPSVCRVGDDFYLVNSSFQYFPGVPIFHSKDLVNWEQIGNVLDRESQLPLRGASSWLGIYAPTIRHHEGTFYMITTNVGNGGNFLVTAKSPYGPWSDPVWLKQEGIDPSLFWEDGRCYMVSNPDDGIWLCEIDTETGAQLSESKLIWSGTGGRYPEGPHIYKKDGYYYLLISEGGTELAHKLTIARSRQIDGPYESNPANPILTNCNQKGQSKQIQGTGHGDFVQAADGSWWIVFLGYRNFGGSYHHLGRETYLAPVEWGAGEWPVINGNEPIDTVMAARLLPQVEIPRKPVRTLFDKPLGPEWIYMQNPISRNYRMRKGKLRLVGHGFLEENSQPTFLGRRQESANMMVETEVSVHPRDTSVAVFQAGLSVFQIHNGLAKIVVVDNQKVVVDFTLKSVTAELGSMPLPRGAKSVKLRIVSDGDKYSFECQTDGTGFRQLAQLDCSLLSTEVAGGFTGATVGMVAEGTNDGSYADFTYFDYTEK